VEIAAAIRLLNPNDWKVDGYNRLLVNSQIFDRFRGGEAPEEIEKQLQNDSLTFLKRRAQFLLYK
jgi:hypothetical protein